MGTYFETRDLSVGYNGDVLIRDICLNLPKGSILTLIGPNGAGKSTILKSITRQLETLGGTVCIGEKDILGWSNRELARHMAVVLTDRIAPELMTCAEVTAMGRYPHTGRFGRLTQEDLQAVEEALARVHALDLADRDYMTLSDGQKQRILLARALCQEPEVLVLDEPTAYLDIRHKIELLTILRDMVRTRDLTVILSLHEIDLAMKISDTVVCVKGETIAACGTPEEILEQGTIEELYGMERGSYNRLFGSVELERPQGEAKVFVLAGAGHGIACFRQLQKRGIPFAAGILFENDTDCQVARALSDRVIAVPAFEPMTQADFDRALAVLVTCRAVLDAGTPVGTLNTYNAELRKEAENRGIPVYHRGQEERLYEDIC